MLKPTWFRVVLAVHDRCDDPADVFLVCKKRQQAALTSQNKLVATQVKSVH
jgi:hypothetical protein